jgi:Ca2+-binding EF-hand superfamily protein
MVALGGSVTSSEVAELVELGNPGGDGLLDLAQFQKAVLLLVERCGPHFPSKDSIVKQSMAVSSHSFLQPTKAPSNGGDNGVPAAKSKADNVHADPPAHDGSGASGSGLLRSILLVALGAKASDPAQIPAAAEVLFDRLDATAQGTVDVGTIVQGMRAFGAEVNDTQVQQLVELGNPGGDGLLDCDQFITAVRTYLAAPPAAAPAAMAPSIAGDGKGGLAAVGGASASPTEMNAAATEPPTGDDAKAETSAPAGSPMEAPQGGRLERALLRTVGDGARDPAQLNTVAETIFGELDPAGDGTVDAEQIRSGMLALGESVSPSEAAELVELGNPGGDGLLDLAQFGEAVNLLDARAARRRNEAADLRSHLAERKKMEQAQVVEQLRRSRS